MFPGSAKLWLEAQPQAENPGCLQISFTVLKISSFFFPEPLAGLGAAPPIVWTTALGNNLGHEFYPWGCNVCSWFCIFCYFFLECCLFTEKLVRATTNQMAESGAATGHQRRLIFTRAREKAPQGQTANMSSTEYYIVFLYHKISAFNNSKENPTGPKVTE